MIRYVDTSVFVTLLVHEPASQAVEAWFERAEITDLALSSWTITEFVSAIGSKVRAGALNAREAKAVLREFHALVHTSLTPIVPNNGDFVAAARLMEQFDLGLRAGDALHVAIAQQAGAARLVTLDKVLARAATQVGLPCELPA